MVGRGKQPLDELRQHLRHALENVVSIGVTFKEKKIRIVQMMDSYTCARTLNLGVVTGMRLSVLLFP